MRISNLHIRAVALVAALAFGSPAVADSEDPPASPQEQLEAVLAERERLEAIEAAEVAAALSRSSRRSRPILAIIDDAEARAVRIAAHQPKAVDTGALPSSLVRHAALRWGALLAWFSLHEDARDAFERAVALGQDDVDTWRQLAWMRGYSGDWPGAEAALLSALERVHAGATPEETVAVLGDLGRLYLALLQPEEAERALERGLELEPNSPRMLDLLALAQHRAGRGVDAPVRPVLLWDDTEADQTRTRWESSLSSLYASLPGSFQRSADRVAHHALTERGGWFFLAALGMLGVLWVLARKLKGRGDLAVTLAYPAELAGSFSVRLATTPGKYKRQTRAAKVAAAQGPTRASTPLEHFAISRETQFLRLRAGLYYVTVEGILHDPASAEVVTDPFDEQAIAVVAKQKVHLDFEVAPREGVVDVRVMWDKRPARDASVAARGFPQSLRYAREGSTRLRLPKGKHIIVVGSGDRVAECEVELESFRAASIDIDLGSRDNLIFKGCPPAVEPYLHGDLSASARALERDGHSNLANLLMARLHREHGRTERAAEHYERAEHWTTAAELRAQLDQYEEAAKLFEQGGDLVRSGEMLRESGELLRAGDCFERANDIDRAIECYEEAREFGKLIDCYERKGAVFTAAQLAVEREDRSRAIRLLQQIQPDHPHFAEACAMLTTAFLQEGHRDLAARKIEERIASSRGATPPDVHAQLADLLEQEGEFDKALSVLSGLREQEPTYPNIATRIEELRKKQSERDLSDSRGQSGGNAPTAFLTTSRYEIIGEIGRGGMGVVLEARDTRLQRVVALKRLPDTLRDHPKAIQLFLREAQAAARLNHPNITTVYDTDQEDGNFFITMERLEGSPISKILKQRGRISPKNAAQLGMQIAAGLDYAHGKGIVHRDIKSANLFFTVDKVVKIMDFGLAKMIEEVRRGTTVIGGTPYYMAPEQAAGESVDARSDIYALGVTLYEFLTGRVPFLEGDVAYQHRHAPVPDPRELAPEVPAEFAALILQMLEKDPNARVASAAEVAQRLLPFIS